eukprot:gene4161-5209_t
MKKPKIFTPVSKLETMFGVDKRACAIFRFMVGLIGLMDLIERWPDIKAHYSDEGIVPRSVVCDHFWNQSWFSFHLFGGIGHGGDVYMRVISYFGMFLPIGAVFSIDSAFKKPVLRRENKKFVVMNFASFAIINQIIYLYIFSYIHKTGEEWRTDYTATYYALQLDYFRTSLANMLLTYHNVLKVMTFSVLYYEGFGFLTLFFPVWTAQIRTIGAMGFTAMHIGFGLFMQLGIFSPICASGTLLLYPTWFWDTLFNQIRSKERSEFKMFYNGRYGYRIAGFVSTFFLLPEVEVAPMPPTLDEESLSLGGGQSKENSNLDHWIVTKDHKGVRHTGFKAFTSICKASPILWPLARILEIRAVTHYGKKIMGVLETIICTINEDILVSKPMTTVVFDPNQGPYSLTDTSQVPDEATNHYYRRLNRKMRFLKFSKRAMLNVIALLSIILALSWNCNTVDCGIPIGVPENLNWFVFLIRMDQMWSMFSPRPPSIHWWYTYEAELDDGTQMELWNNEGLFTWEGNPAPYSREKPDPYHECIGNHRWFKVYENINTGNGYELVRLGMGRWVCREWNARHTGDKRLYKFNMVYRNEKQNLDDTRTLLNDVVLWSHVCYDKPTPNQIPLS